MAEGGEGAVFISKKFTVKNVPRYCIFTKSVPSRLRDCAIIIRSGGAVKPERGDTM